MKYIKIAELSRNHPLCILADGESDNLIYFSDNMVPVSVYNQDTPIEFLVDNQDAGLIDTQEVGTYIATNPRVPLYSAAIVIKTKARTSLMERDHAKVMVASALALGQPLPLVLAGSDIGYILEAAKVCFVSEIEFKCPAEYSAYIDQHLKNFQPKTGEHASYRIMNRLPTSEQALLAISTCLTYDLNENEALKNVQPVFDSFGSSTTTPVKQPTRGPVGTPSTPEPQPISDSYAYSPVYRVPTQVLITPLRAQMSYLGSPTFAYLPLTVNHRPVPVPFVVCQQNTTQQTQKGTPVNTGNHLSFENSHVLSPICPGYGGLGRRPATIMTTTPAQGQPMGLGPRPAVI